MRFWKIAILALPVIALGCSSARPTETARVYGVDGAASGLEVGGGRGAALAGYREGAAGNSVSSSAGGSTGGSASNSAGGSAGGAEALAFSPPVAANVPPMALDSYLDRSGRGQTGYVGYESSSTVGVINFDDRQFYSDLYRGGGGFGYGRGGRGGYGGGSSGSQGYLDRRAVSQTAVVRER